MKFHWWGGGRTASTNYFTNLLEMSRGWAVKIGENGKGD